MQTVPVKKLHPHAKLPTYGSECAAGADLYACVEADITIVPGDTALIPTGIAVEIPVGYVGLVYARSGLACKIGLAPANKVGVIDCDYRGQILVALHNHGNVDRTVEPGMRIAQMVITPYLTVQYQEAETLSDTCRGEGGFGSTGAK